VFARIADSDAADVDAAVAAAEKALPGWTALGREGRSNVLLKLAAVIERDLEAFAEAESRDNGKPVHLAREVDIPRAVANLRFFATAILHWHSEAHVMDEVAVNYTLRQPLGRGRLHQPVEPAAVPVHLEDRPGAGRGQPWWPSPARSRR
jgi:aminomuconate-semialdehyde/2-hydroxymuconate-6-semialdehyde dehydrogenase